MRVLHIWFFLVLDMDFYEFLNNIATSHWMMMFLQSQYNVCVIVDLAFLLKNVIDIMGDNINVSF